MRRLFRVRTLLLLLFSLGVLVVGGFCVLYLVVDVPDANALAKAQSNVYKYRDGSILARTGDVNRESVPLSRVPKDVQHTFVAAENKSFYTDPGVDLKGTVRGIANTLLGRGVQGGSTITQQYVKNYYLNQQQTVSRKLREVVISLKVSRQKSKDDILDGYLNTCYYGRGAYGIQAAARAYYDEDASRLTVAQGAYLAALLQAPSEYDWSAATPTGRRLVTDRWNYVLDNMVRMHWLGGARRHAMTFPTPVAPRAAPGLSGQAGYLVKAADQELVTSGVSEQEIAAGGWTVTLSVDPAKQRALESAVRDRLLRHLDPGVRKVDGEAQTGAVSVDPKTGQVVALYGGAGYTTHYVDNATREDYQPASTFKPVILASALEHHATTQAGSPIGRDTVYDGTSGRPVRGSGTPFAPPNEDHRDYGQITVQTAMNNSVNSVFAQMAVDVGLDRVKQTGVDLGMNPHAGGFDVRPAMSLGVMGASPEDMAGVYATLDDHGRRVTPSLVTSAEKGGERAGLPDPVGGQAISRSTADTVTSVLTGVVAEGTGTAVRQAGQAVAGKTGTSDQNRSAWFVGYTPDLVTAVGMFGEASDGRQVSLSGTGGGGRVNGGGYPAQIWAGYMTDVLRGHPASAFDLDTGAGPTGGPSSPPSSTATGSQPGTTPPGSTPPGDTSGPPPTTPPVTPPSSTPPGGPTGPGGPPSGSPPPTDTPGDDRSDLWATGPG